MPTIPLPDGIIEYIAKRFYEAVKKNESKIQTSFVAKEDGEPLDITCSAKITQKGAFIVVKDSVAFTMGARVKEVNEASFDPNQQALPLNGLDEE